MTVISAGGDLFCIMWLSEDEWKSSARVQETQLAFPPRAQRSAFRRRDVRLQAQIFRPLE